MKDLLEVQNLSIGHTRVLQKGLNFKIKEGEILFIKGDNGVGKSTLLKTILGHQKALKGEIIRKTSMERCCYLPQEINQDFPLAITLEEILRSFSLKNKVTAVLGDNLKKKRWADASGGERQKTLVATRLQKNTEILILDEPFNHMDDKNIRKITTLIFNLIQTKNLKACLLISHDLFKNTQEISIRELELS